MRYSFTCAALLAATVVAVPVPQNSLGDALINLNGGGSDNINVPRADATIIGDVDAAAKAVGVKNAKRQEDIGSAVKAGGEGEAIDVKNAKRQGLIDDIGAAVKVSGDGDTVGVKNAKRQGLVDDIGVAVSGFGDGDTVGVQNAKRAADTQPMINAIDASDATESEKAAAKTIIGNVALAVKILGKGDVSGVENAATQQTDSILGDIDLPLQVLSNGKLIGTS